MISPSPRTSKLTLGVSCQVPLKSHLLAADKLAARGGSTHRSEDGREPGTPVERRSHGPARRTRDPRPQPLVFPRSRLLVAGPAFFPDISGAPPSVSFAPSARAPPPPPLSPVLMAVGTRLLGDRGGPPAPRSVCSPS